VSTCVKQWCPSGATDYVCLPGATPISPPVFTATCSSAAGLSAAFAVAFAIVLSLAAST
jgi:hypothetical protein